MMTKRPNTKQVAFMVAASLFFAVFAYAILNTNDLVQKDSTGPSLDGEISSVMAEDIEFSSVFLNLTFVAPLVLSQYCIETTVTGMPARSWFVIPSPVFETAPKQGPPSHFFTV